MNKYCFILPLLLLSFASCKQETKKSNEYEIEFEDLEKKYGHLFNASEDSSVRKSDNLQTFSTSAYNISFQTIDYDLFKNYLANLKNIPFNQSLPKSIRHKDSCFFVSQQHFKDTLCDNLDDDFSAEYVDYRFLGYWDSLNYAIFESGIYEELVYFVYDMHNGNKTFLWNIPILSPSQKFMLTFSFDLVAGFQPNGLQLFELQTEDLDKQFEIQFHDWGPDSCFWIDDNEVVFKRTILNFEDYSVEKEEYMLMKIEAISS